MQIVKTGCSDSAGSAFHVGPIDSELFMDVRMHCAGAEHCNWLFRKMNRLQRTKRFCGYKMAADGSRWQFLGGSPPFSPPAT